MISVGSLSAAGQYSLPLHSTNRNKLGINRRLSHPSKTSRVFTSNSTITCTTSAWPYTVLSINEFLPQSSVRYLKPQSLLSPATTKEVPPVTIADQPPSGTVKSILPCTPLAVVKCLEYLRVYNTILPYGDRAYGKTITVINRFVLFRHEVRRLR